VTARYSLADIQELARSGSILFANRRAERNATELDWTIQTVTSFICALNDRHHKGVRLNLSIFDGRDSIDADKYKARFNEETMSVTVDSRHCAYFVELALRKLHNGATVLVVSIHLDGQA
jgi:hypothetical protein